MSNASNAFANSIKPKGNFAKFATIGDSITIKINTQITEQQSKKFGTKELMFFPSGDPIMEQVIAGLNIQAATEEEAPTILIVDKVNMRQAIGAALQEVGASAPEIGGTLQVTFTGFGVGKNPANPPKVFSAKYLAPVAEGGAWGAPAQQ